MAGDPVPLRQLIHCAAQDCLAWAPKRERTDGRPLAPPDWYEVVIDRTVLFAHSKRCAQAVAAGVTGTATPMSDYPVFDE